ncbi:DNA primase family protein [Macrococcus brunensis]|uniref:DNA primase family protein n=1 Tax=Macrococcus brunensis TaxID=198483 RepID=UPI001EF1318E|nr:phage/plasmid primase, P4 family [Macrococcus brunensis]ULG73194.1 phage/plasmid primase, P4 family [Macrococcus brunensis]
MALDTQLMDQLAENNEKDESQHITDLRIARNYKQFYQENKNGSKSFLHEKFAKALVQHYHIITLDEQLHIYNDGVYKPSEMDIRRACITELPALKQAQIREVLEYARLIAPEKEHASPYLVPLLNGVYDLQSKELLDFTPEIIATSKINAKYDPDASASTSAEIVNHALLTIANEDLEVLQLFLEMVGYVLFKKNFLDKAFLLVGNGGNGKSTFMNMLSSFVGEENVSAVSLSGLSERFNVAELHHKLLNAGDDIPLQTIKDASNFKKLATGERITAERKGQDPFTFRNYSKLIFSANDVPRWFENNNGIFDRIVIVPLNAQLRNSKKRDPFLESKITTEEARSHLLNLGLRELSKLLKERRFTIPVVSTQRMEEFKTDNNPILSFLAEYEVHDQPISEVYTKYQKWCEIEGFKFPLPRSTFTKSVLAVGYEKSKRRLDNYHNPQWCFTKFMTKDEL